MSFTLDPRIAAASAFVADLPLCQVRLQDDARWPWLVLIPRRDGLIEIEELDPGDRAVLVDEAVLAGRVVRALDPAVRKLNVAALGNIVAQLHVHVVGRWRADLAWPGPVWGHGAPEPYGERLAATAARAAALLAA